jgi:hypothetical protein
VILNEGWQVVEGLVVDSKSGGVGFRNHTIPLSSTPYGGIWSEDLLFVEPVTECVNLNLTLEFTIQRGGFGVTRSVRNLALVDRGGFFAINKTKPVYDRSGGAGDHRDPHLASRAYEGAWLTNLAAMFLWNVTDPNLDGDDLPPPFSYLDSHAGKAFLFPPDEDPLYITHNSLYVGDYQGWVYTALNTNHSAAPPNPWNLTNGNFSLSKRVLSLTLFFYNHQVC